jgi:hypothetical protein
VRPQDDMHGGSAAQAQVGRVVSKQRDEEKGRARAGQTQTETGGN